MAITLAQKSGWTYTNTDDANQEGIVVAERDHTMTLSSKYINGPITVNIGTSEETLTIANLAPDVGSNPLVLIFNLDATNFVQLGFATTDYNNRIEALGKYEAQIDTETILYVKADTAACDLEVWLAPAPS